MSCPSRSSPSSRRGNASAPRVRSFPDRTDLGDHDGRTADPANPTVPQYRRRVRPAGGMRSPRGPVGRRAPGLDASPTDTYCLRTRSRRGAVRRSGPLRSRNRRRSCCDALSRPLTRAATSTRRHHRVQPAARTPPGTARRGDRRRGARDSGGEPAARQEPRGRGCRQAERP